MTDSFFRNICDTWEINGIDVNFLSPLTLAYIGDNVYETVNRVLVLKKPDRRTELLHKECSARAKAPSQAKLIEAIRSSLTEEEETIYKRGRNASVHTKAKNATTLEYHEATGLEALIGYLYLTGREERILELLKDGFERLERNRL